MCVRIAIKRAARHADAILDNIDLDAVRQYLENLRVAAELPAYVIFDDPHEKSGRGFEVRDGSSSSTLNADLPDGH